MRAVSRTGAFRRSEFYALEGRGPDRTPDGLRVTIRRSKTDQEGQGAEVAVLRGCRLRPVEAVWQRAVEGCGCTMEDFVRTSHHALWKDAARAHGETFHAIRPACTFVQVVRFIDPEWLVEIEADCVRPG